jgi:hypothetical protein
MYVCIEGDEPVGIAVTSQLLALSSYLSLTLPHSPSPPLSLSFTHTHTHTQGDLDDREKKIEETEGLLKVRERK